MFRKKKVLVLGSIVAVALAATVAGVALAQTSPTPPTPPQAGKTITARVAEILKIDQKTLEDAFSQARGEASNDALDARLQQMVASGKITKEQAEQYKKWWQSRPQNLPGLGPSVQPGFPGMQPRMHRQFPMRQLPTN